jgi:hypothetical protein
MSVTKDDSYYENIDKRTREYKDWVALKEVQIEQATKGLGDVVEKITTVTGIKALTKTFFGDEDCGCGNRKDALNEALPFGITAVNCPTEEDYFYMKSFFSRERTRVDRSQQLRIVDIYNHIFAQHMVAPVGCPTCSQKGFIKAINKLHKYYDAVQLELNTDNNEEE